MRVMLFAALVLTASFSLAAADPVTQQPEASAPELIAAFNGELARNEPVAAAIGEMAARDQALRAITIELMQRPMSDETRHAFLAGTQAAYDRIDGENTRRLEAILAHTHWEDLAALGQQVPDQAFLIVTHSKDNAFKQRMVAIFEPLARAGRARGEYVALLADDLAESAGRPQVYGTNWDCIGGVYQMKPTEDVAHLNDRRAALHMDSIEQYGASMRQLYGDCPTH